MVRLVLLTCLSPPVFLLNVSMRCFFCGSFLLFLVTFVFIMLSCLFLATLWSSAWKRMTYWLSCVWPFLVPLSLSNNYGISGQVRYLIYRFLIFAFFLTLTHRWKFHPLNYPQHKAIKPFQMGWNCISSLAFITGFCTRKETKSTSTCICLLSLLQFQIQDVIILFKLFVPFNCRKLIAKLNSSMWHFIGGLLFSNPFGPKI